MVLSATGHRPDKLGGYSNKVLSNLIDTAVAGITKLNPDKIISGMALGWDTAVAIAAIKLKIPLIAAVPFKGQERVWTPTSKELYYKILHKAEVVYVCDGGYAPWKLQKRNEYMINNSTTTLALWNGTSGGTGNCIKYATSKSHNIINMWDYYNKTYLGGIV